MFKFLNIFKRDDSHEFEPILAEIEDRPQNPLGRSLFWILVFLLLITVLILFFGRVDVVVSAQGKAIPVGNIKIIQPLEIGVIESIPVKEGQFVKKGDLLVEINPESVDPALVSSKETLEELKEEIARLKADTQNTIYKGKSDLQKSISQSSRNELGNQIQIKRFESAKASEEIAILNSQAKNNAHLLSSALEKQKRQRAVVDIISKDEYQKTLSEVSQYKSNAVEISDKKAELYEQKAQLSSEIALINASYKKENLNTLETRHKEVLDLEARVRETEFKSTQQRLVSPVDGYVNTILVTTIGGVVTPAQQLMSVIPVETPIIAKASFSSHDAGFIKEGMPVSIKIDTFDFQKYGMLEGVVKTVSKDSIQDEKLGPVYEIFITPKTTSLKVEGREEKLSSGMTLTCEVKISKRRIIEFFIYPLVKYLGESVSVR